MGLSSSAVYNRSREISFPNNCGVLNSNCFTLAVGKEYTEIVTVNQMICRSLEHSILCEPYNMPPWRHVAFAVLYLLQDKPILHASVGSFRTPYPQFENLQSKEFGSFVDCSFRIELDTNIFPRSLWIELKSSRVVFQLRYYHPFEMSEIN